MPISSPDATRPGRFKLGGGDVSIYVGAEFRRENYRDQYDSLSEAGQIIGSAGNSAGGTRE